jgi:hypothetical protein
MARPRACPVRKPDRNSPEYQRACRRLAELLLRFADGCRAARAEAATAEPATIPLTAAKPKRARRAGGRRS